MDFFFFLSNGDHIECVSAGGGSCNCLVKILGHQEGPFAFTLECSVDGSQQLFPFFVSGEIQVCLEHDDSFQIDCII